MTSNRFAVLRIASLAMLLLSGSLACTEDKKTGPKTTCDTQDCGAQSLDELLGDIEGFSDPFAVFLRTTATKDGSIVGNYRTILEGVGDVESCVPKDAASFVVLSNNGYFPRTIFTNCADQPTKASRFFLLAPIIQEGPDTDPQELHLSAWDEEAGRYRHYATSQDNKGEMRVLTQPAYCLDCHGGTEPLPYWQPLMNEMRNPWSQWNAEPGFRSHIFDEYLDSDFAVAPTFQKMVEETPLRPASEFESIVRTGIARVIGNRIRLREDSPELRSALRLLRPVFCDETVNFVSEIHQGGEISSAAVVDDALRNLFASMRPGGWDFVSESSFRLPAPSQDEERVILLPIRGESTVAAEASLLPRRVLSAEDLLRVRLLDYSHPVASAFRCSLFEKGEARVRSGILDSEIVALPSEATNTELVGLLYTEFMKVELQGGGTRALLSDESGKGRFLAIADIDSALAQAYLSTGDVSGLIKSIDEIGDDLQSRISSASRAVLLGERDTRACKTRLWFAGTPDIPDLNCP